MKVTFTRPIWAIADQGLYSLSNFALTLLLARWMLAREYGAFATSYAILILLLLVHTAVLAEPMLVFGSRKYQDRILTYYRVLVRFHVATSLVFAGALLIVFYLLRSVDQPSLAEGVLGISLSVVFTLLFYLYRKVCYLIDRIPAGALSGAVYFVLIVCGGYALAQNEWLTVLSAYLLMGAAALVATAVLHITLGIGFAQTGEGRIHADEVLSDHVRYGRWAFGTGVLIWFPANVYYIVLPYVDGLEINAAFRAVMNLVMPVVQANMALANVLLPGLARIPTRKEFDRHLRNVGVAFALGAALYWVLIAGFGEPLMVLLYKGKYVEQSPVLWLVGAVPVVSWFALAERSALKAVERPDLVFWATLVSAATALTAGVYLTYRYQVVGAVLGMLTAYGMMWIVLNRLRVRTVRRLPWKPEAVLVQTEPNA